MVFELGNGTGYCADDLVSHNLISVVTDHRSIAIVGVYTDGQNSTRGAVPAEVLISSPPCGVRLWQWAG